MKSIQDILRPVLCVLSVIVFWLLGAVGEALLNLPVYQRLREDFADATPDITQFFLGNFHLNAGHFMLSLTPFMLLMLTVAVMHRRCQQPALYWFLFAGVWLLAVAYFLVFVLALLAPFHLLLVVIDDSPVPEVVWTINTVLAISLVAVWAAMRVRRSGE